MIPTLLTAFYLTTGTSLEWARDPLDGYADTMHMEPRIKFGAGFGLHPIRRMDLDIGARYQAMPFGQDSKDNTLSIFMDIRYRPFSEQ